MISKFFFFKMILDAKSELAGAWVAGTVDTNQYVEINMGEDYKFTQVHIQGRDDADEWVTSFKVHYYDNTTDTWLEYTDGTGQNVSAYLNCCRCCCVVVLRPR